MDDKKLLIDYKLGEIIDSNDCERYFGKEFMEIFNGKIKLVAISWTIMDEDETLMDYKLEHKEYPKEEEAKTK